MEKHEFWAKMDRLGVSRAEFAAGMGMNISSVYNWNDVPQYAIYILNFLEDCLGEGNIIIGREEWEGLVATQERWFGAKEMARTMMEGINGRR